jgi:Animal haem peroxidase
MRDGNRRRGRPNVDIIGLARHGRPAPRGEEPLPGARAARFGRMFPNLPPADTGKAAIAKLAVLMLGQAGGAIENDRIPAGYTYFGQFVDHDVTFDPTSSLQRRNDPRALVDFRTPRLDLDSVYGSGPIDQPFLYNWRTEDHRGVKLLVGGDRSRPTFADVDLPRNAQGRALIGDARNDENHIVSQLHLQFILFHNKVVDRLLKRRPGIDSRLLFEEAQRTVRWHYQWIVLHDFLPRIVESTPATFGSVGARPLIDRRFFAAQGGPFMPVEFSAAAYRFGHSMVREDYQLRDHKPNVPVLSPRSPGEHDLRGFRRLRADQKIQWKHFFPLAAATEPQDSMRIDVSLAKQLSDLPDDHEPLASLNLRRGWALELPAGRRVARAMSKQPLGDDELLGPLLSARKGTPPPRIDRRTREAVLEETPLWYYVLCEALAIPKGKRLGPVGGGIVAEVLLGLIEADPSSYLNRGRPWKPELSKHDDRSFTMADLVRFVETPLPD